MGASQRNFILFFLREGGVGQNANAPAANEAKLEHLKKKSQKTFGGVTAFFWGGGGVPP